LENGGNAVDAAIAAVAAQGVVAPETCGLGGDLFALIHRPGWDRPRALNASGRAGSGAAAEVLRAQGHSAVPRDHPLTVTIPGCVDGLVALAGELGDISLGDSLAPAIELAEEGFQVSTEQAHAFGGMAPVYGDNPAVTEFYPGGAPVRKGDRVHRPRLAATLRLVAEGGRDAFYKGIPGEDIVAAVGGAITREDLDRPQAEWVDPIAAEVAGLVAWTVPPNSQGYLGPGTLAVFEMLDPPQDPSDPLWWHLLVEAYRCVAWARNDLVADPDHLALPTHLLLDGERLERSAATVSPDRTGTWPRSPAGGAGTAYLCVADGDGLAVSIIQSNYRGTGSPFGAARSGFLLQDRGGGFSLTPGHPNEMAPHKRPLHTLSPTLWTGGDQPRWLLGTRGGGVQPQLIAQVAARAILGGAALEEAQGAPRWTVPDFGPGAPPRLVLEPGIPQGICDGLAARGHSVEMLEAPQPGWGPVSIIEIDGAERRAAADPRVETSSGVVF
jgi:gamma-glutamyltranspeptidase/glutathione hydrolase